MEFTQEIVRELFRYDPETGKLFWRKRDPKWFKDGAGRFSAKSQCNSWNTRFAGREVSPKLDDKGYTRINLRMGISYAQRIIWLYENGPLPEGCEIDHINGDRSDNRLENLRAVTRAENLKNKRKYKNSPTGVSGVLWEADRKKWSAKIRVQKRLHRLGCFSNFEDAVAARKAAEAEYGYHPNHGRSR